jgi:hypothetical protein
MFILSAKKEDVLSDFPYVKEWIDNAQTNFIKSEIEESNMDFYYTYGFFVPKVDNREELYTDMYEKTSKMLFEDRLNFELSKVRVNLTMKIGKHFMLTNRLEKGSLPSMVKTIVTELTKVKMTIESEYSENEEVKSSIPEIDRDIVNLEIIKDVIEKDYDIKDFDIDDLLDKINEAGIESLSDEERDFLNKKSKDL